LALLRDMNIGFDAKRAYHNQTGLGHYSRTLIHSLAKDFSENEYYLFNTKPSSLFSFDEKNVHEILPSGVLSKMFPSAWRSSWVTADLGKMNIDLYHGLSHEIPFGIPDTKIPAVVTMHDLIHERYPEQYNPIDVRIYSKKFRYACRFADKVIAISEQTRRDLIDFYQTPADKITVCYQSCNPAFGETVTEAQKQIVRMKYDLPAKFFLYVGSIIERKNLLNICKAVFLLRKEFDLPLVVIGNGGKYKQQVADYIKQNGIDNRIIFLSDRESAKASRAFQSAEDFPAIYQSALAMIYPSFFEGFGIPVLEALWSRLPVITSKTSCLPEAGGDAAFYVDPNSAEEIAAGMKLIVSDPAAVAAMKEKGWRHAQKFSTSNAAAAVMNVYHSIKNDR
jgi:glycosyltransferase involved in cell wall biosynthesis